MFLVTISFHIISLNAIQDTSTAQSINLLLHLLNAAFLAVHLLLQGIQARLRIGIHLSQLGALAHGHSKLGSQHITLSAEEEGLQENDKSEASKLMFPKNMDLKESKALGK